MHLASCRGQYGIWAIPATHCACTRRCGLMSACDFQPGSPACAASAIAPLCDEEASAVNLQLDRDRRHRRCDRAPELRLHPPLPHPAPSTSLQPPQPPQPYQGAWSFTAQDTHTMTRVLSPARRPPPLHPQRQHAASDGPTSCASLPARSSSQRVSHRMAAAARAAGVAVPASRPVGRGSSPHAGGWGDPSSGLNGPPKPGTVQDQSSCALTWHLPPKALGTAHEAYGRGEASASAVSAAAAMQRRRPASAGEGGGGGTVPYGVGDVAVASGAPSVAVRRVLGSSVAGGARRGEPAARAGRAGVKATAAAVAATAAAATDAAATAQRLAVLVPLWEDQPWLQPPVAERLGVGGSGASQQAWDDPTLPTDFDLDVEAAFSNPLPRRKARLPLPSSIFARSAMLRGEKVAGLACSEPAESTAALERAAMEGTSGHPTASTEASAAAASAAAAGLPGAAAAAQAATGEAAAASPCVRRRRVVLRRQRQQSALTFLRLQPRLQRRRRRRRRMSAGDVDDPGRGVDPGPGPGGSRPKKALEDSATAAFRAPTQSSAASVSSTLRVSNAAFTGYMAATAATAAAAETLSYAAESGPSASTYSKTEAAAGSAWRRTSKEDGGGIVSRAAAAAVVDTAPPPSSTSGPATATAIARIATLAPAPFLPSSPPLFPLLSSPASPPAAAADAPPLSPALLPSPTAAAVAAAAWPPARPPSAVTATAALQHTARCRSAATAATTAVQCVGGVEAVSAPAGAVTAQAERSQPPVEALGDVEAGPVWSRSGHKNLRTSWVQSHGAGRLHDETAATAARQLMRAITGCRHWRQLWAIVRTYGDDLNALHVTALLGKMAHVQLPLLPAVGRRAVAGASEAEVESLEAVEVQALLTELEAAFKRHLTLSCAAVGHSSASHNNSNHAVTGAVPSPLAADAGGSLIGPRQLATSLAALAKLCAGGWRGGAGGRPGVRHLAVAAAAQWGFDSFSPQELTTLLYALAKIGHSPDAAWMAGACAAAEAAAAAQRMSPRQLATTLWALASLRHRPGGRFMAAWLAASHRALPLFSAYDISQALWALATLRQAAAAAATSVAVRGIDVDADADADLLASTYHERPSASAPPLPYNPPETWLADAMARAAAVLRPGACEPQDVCNTLWAVAQLGVSPPRTWVMSLAAAVLAGPEATLRRCGPADVAGLMWALVRLLRGGPPPPARDMLRLSLAAAGLAGRCDERDLGNALWALGALRFRPPLEVMRALGARLVVLMGRGAAGPQLLSTALWCCVRLHLPPGPGLLHPLLAACSARAADFQPHSTALLLYSLARLRYLGWLPPGLLCGALSGHPPGEDNAGVQAAAATRAPTTVGPAIGPLPSLEPILASALRGMWASREGPSEAEPEGMAEAEARGGDCRPITLPVLLWSVSRLGLRPEEGWMRGVMVHSIEVLPHLSPSEASVVVSALVWLGYQPPPIWVDRMEQLLRCRWGPLAEEAAASVAAAEGRAVAAATAAGAVAVAAPADGLLGEDGQHQQQHQEGRQQQQQQQEEAEEGHQKLQELREGGQRPRPHPKASTVGHDVGLREEVSQQPAQRQQQQVDPREGWLQQKSVQHGQQQWDQQQQQQQWDEHAEALRELTWRRAQLSHLASALGRLRRGLRVLQVRRRRHAAQALRTRPAFSDPSRTHGSGVTCDEGERRAREHQRP